MNWESKIIKMARNNISLPDSTKLHFSFILKKKKVISFGWNLGYKSCPEAAKYHCRFNSIHAELMAIRNFPYRISDLPRFTFVNVRLRKNGELALSKPCISCQNMLYVFGVNKLYYSNNEGEFIQW